MVPGHDGAVSRVSGPAPPDCPSYASEPLPDGDDLHEVEVVASPVLDRSVSAVDSGYKGGDYDENDDDDDDDSSSCCSSRSYGSGSHGSGAVKEAVHDGLGMLENTTFGDVTVKNSENVQIGNNTHFHGRVTVLLSTSNAINGVPLPAVLPRNGDDLVLSAAALEAKQCEAKQCEASEQSPPAYSLHSPSPLTGKGQDSRREVDGRCWFWKRPRFAIALCVLIVLGIVAGIVSVFLDTVKGVPKAAPAQLPNGLTIVNRDEWLAQPPNSGVNDLTTPVDYVILHHSATEACFSYPECLKRTRFIQMFHMESKNWSDIGYNFLVGGDGYAYVGRGWDKEGAHTFNWNVRSIGICLIGTFTYEYPTIEQLKAFLKLVEYGVTLGKISAEYKLAAVCQLRSTESPGKLVYKQIVRWDHWWNYTLGESNCGGISEKSKRDVDRQHLVGP